MRAKVTDADRAYMRRLGAVMTEIRTRPDDASFKEICDEADRILRGLPPHCTLEEERRSDLEGHLLFRKAVLEYEAKRARMSENSEDALP